MNGPKTPLFRRVPVHRCITCAKCGRGCSMCQRCSCFGRALRNPRTGTTGRDEPVWGKPVTEDGTVVWTRVPNTPSVAPAQREGETPTLTSAWELGVRPHNVGGCA